MADNGGPAVLGPGTMPAHDPAGPGTIGWEEMVEIERLACCLAAVLARLRPLDAQRMRYNRNTRVASAWRDDPVDVERLKVWEGNKTVVLPGDQQPRKQLGQWWCRPGETTDSIKQKIGAAGGVAAVEETSKLTAPPRRWFGSRKKR